MSARLTITNKVNVHTEDVKHELTELKPLDQHLGIIQTVIQEKKKKTRQLPSFQDLETTADTGNYVCIQCNEIKFSTE